MIKDNQRYFNRLHFLLDVLVIVGSYMLAWYLKFQTEFFDHIGDRLSFEKYMFALWGIVPGYLLLYQTCPGEKTRDWKYYQGKYTWCAWIYYITLCHWTT